MLSFIPLAILKSIFVLTSIGSAQSPPEVGPQPEDTNLKGTSFLDHETPIRGFWGQTFLKENIPFIDIPHSSIQDVYYYRWSSIQRHLRYTIAGTGYVITEFCQPVGYAQALNTIDAAAGHQIDEARWLRSNFYNDDYIQVYTRGPGNTTQYTHWIIDSAWRRSQVDGNSQFIEDQLNDMTRIWEEWDYTFDNSAGLYYFTPDFDAQEYSLPGYVADPSGDSSLQLIGPDTFRPSHNAYMVANARAISDIANQAGSVDIASNFTQIAANIESAMLQHLWDPVQGFFVDVIRPNNPNLTKIAGREEVGLYPFRFSIGMDPAFLDPASQELFDPEGFLTTYGPTSLEVRNQYYDATRPSDYCCYWNGQSWPFSTAHILKSLAAIHRTSNSTVTADQFVQYLAMYAATQQKNGVPYVAESHYPSMNSWSADSSNHSEHYQHSTNNDDVITGLLGIIPRSDEILEISPIIPSNWTYFAIENLGYHSHLVTVLYDADGTRYDNGTGLSVFVDGTKVYNGEGSSALITLPSPQNITSVVPVNIAANPNGLGAYPIATATFTYTLDSPYKAIDGYLFYDDIPDNRWTNYQSTSENDTLQITFARPRNVSSITLALYSDVARGGAIDVPSMMNIYGSSGLIATISNATAATEFVPNDRNTFSFDQVETEFLAVNLFNKPNLYVGVCEFEVWTPPILGPNHYAVDALLTEASVVNDQASTATVNGAVVGNLGDSSVVAFSGIFSYGGSTQLTLSYANFGTSPISIGISVNQVVQGSMTLEPSHGAYVSVLMDVFLAAGKNFVSLLGGAPDVKYEILAFTTG